MFPCSSGERREANHSQNDRKRCPAPSNRAEIRDEESPWVTAPGQPRGDEGIVWLCEVNRVSMRRIYDYIKRPETGGTPGCHPYPRL